MSPTIESAVGGHWLVSDLKAFYQPGRLTVFVDIADPYSHLALPGTLRLLRQTKRCAYWYPFVRPALKKPEPPFANESRGAAHRRFRGEYRERELRFYATALDLPLRQLYKQPNTLPFANALLWLSVMEPSSTRVPAFVQTCFSRYWSATLQIDHCNELAQLLTNSGADGEHWLRAATADGYLTEGARAQTEAHVAAARAAGLFNTPAYLYDDEVFYGRAHLPLLLRRLEASAG